jgi:chromosome partitioning protein
MAALMKTLAVVSRKGGAGKTTISTHLAVAAEGLGIATALFDLDPQASAALWADHRGESFPAVVPAQHPRLPSLLRQAEAQGAGLVILDTPPEADTIAAAAAEHADAILIPCRPSGLDLDAIGASVRIARSVGKSPFVVINAAPVQGAEVEETRAALRTGGVEVAPVVLHQRKAFSARMQEGRTAIETEPKGKAAEEIRALLLWLCEKVGVLQNKQDIKITSVGAL